MKKEKKNSTLVCRTKQSSKFREQKQGNMFKLEFIFKCSVVQKQFKAQSNQKSKLFHNLSHHLFETLISGPSSALISLFVVLAFFRRLLSRQGWCHPIFCVCLYCIYFVLMCDTYIGPQCKEY